MNAIQSLFLRAKHWQLLLLFLACWCLGTTAMLRSMLVAPADAFRNPFPFFAAIEVFAILFATWLWSIVKMLDAVVPATLRMRVSLFRFAVTFPPLYLPIFVTFFTGLNMRLSVGQILAAYAIIFFLHAFALLCQVYSWYFVSKCLALAERSQPVTFSDYQAILLGLWFFPVGVWFIQPRINRFYAERLNY